MEDRWLSTRYLSETKSLQSIIKLNPFTVSNTGKNWNYSSNRSPNYKKYLGNHDPGEYREIVNKYRKKYVPVEEENGFNRKGKIVENVDTQNYPNDIKTISREEVVIKHLENQEDSSNSETDSSIKVRTIALLKQVMANFREELSGPKTKFVGPAKLRERTETQEFKMHVPTDVTTAKRQEAADKCRRRRVHRPFLEKVLSKMLLSNQLSETQTVLCQLDPTFTMTDFVRDFETDFAPNILGAVLSGDLRLLKGWCAQRVYEVLASGIQRHKAEGRKLCSTLLSVGEVDVDTGRLTQEGPLLGIVFNAYIVNCIRDKSGALVEGDPHKAVCVSYVWTMIRDIDEIHPKAAWRLYGIPSESRELLF